MGKALVLALAVVALAGLASSAEAAERRARSAVSADVTAQPKVRYYRHRTGGVRGYRPRVECGEKRLRVLCGCVECVGAVRHEPNLLLHATLAAISSNAAIVENSLVASCGSGQLDSLAATRPAARLT